ncbi:hypothetical protein C464_13020 [Halorubrum coriense DSM 10284]|uniref:Uncharacterized protein n=1 Tax=Halorubrum coriense DSM 10284 TaxID=1227466 RepID=M0ECL8_9EURY|nr:hypothetical protein [Halorubrum coriense]ELZ44622.1 hypothetical protein C464_13020 [Halorubrum coriense DSM 10284]
MVAEILITGVVRTFVEIIPFAAMIAIELRGTSYQRLYRSQFKAVKSAPILPDFTHPDGDDEAAVREVATFTRVKHDTQKYAVYSFVVITVIFFSKMPTILALPAESTVQTGIVGVGILLWAVAAYLLYRWRSSAKEFYDDVLPFNYFRAENDKRYYRSLTLPRVGTQQLQRHRADLFLFNVMPILIILIFNSVLICTDVLVTTSGGGI